MGWSRTGPRRLLVNPASASQGRTWEVGDDFIISLNGDHSSMVKFSENDQNGYEKVLYVVQSLTSNANTAIEARIKQFSSPDPHHSEAPTLNPSVTDLGMAMHRELASYKPGRIFMSPSLKSSNALRRMFAIFVLYGNGPAKD